MKLKDHKASQCHVVIDDNKNIYFISYTTEVIRATVNPATGNYELSCSGTYSNTTAKQINWFLSEYFPVFNYYDMKGIAGTKKVISYPSREGRYILD